MRKKRKEEEQDGADRWVVSYADFITLLFAFFTTMYAISRVDLGKLAMFEGSMKSAFKASGAHPAETTVIEGIKPVNYADIGLEKDLRAQFKKFAIIDGIGISRDERGVILSLGDSVLYDSSEADLKEAAKPLLATVVQYIKKTQRSIIIEGHTDNIPLRGGRYSSNLELSTIRAARAFSFLLQEDPGIHPEQISTAGYGEFRPVASNATPEGRALNRRIDIIFVARKDGT